MRIAIGLEYDGGGFLGWQSQPGGNTVQDALEVALAQIAGVPLRVTCAGRTDAGVHGLAQVVHFDTWVERPMTAWVRGTNAHLPAGVAVRWAAEPARATGFAGGEGRLVPSTARSRADAGRGKLPAG